MLERFRRFGAITTEFEIIVKSSFRFRFWTTTPRLRHVNTLTVRLRKSCLHIPPIWFPGPNPLHAVRRIRYDTFRLDDTCPLQKGSSGETRTQKTGISREIVGNRTRLIKKTSFVRAHGRSALVVVVVVAARTSVPRDYIIFTYHTHIVDTCSNSLAAGRVIYLARFYIRYPFLSYSYVYVTFRRSFSPLNRLEWKNIRH